MRMIDLIVKKRNGLALTADEIDFFIRGYNQGEIPDYQASALAMAIYFQDMNEQEKTQLTLSIVRSGDQVDLSAIEGIKVDKHSTGGVADTTTLVIAPLMAALGIPMAKISGRGLGHTGGTIDKLESIPGFHVEITNQEFIELVNKNKVAVIGQSANLTPADKKLYALRDVTGTVDSIALIASSIMSKKIAAGADAIILDVKTGSGAFMKNEKEAIELAKTMVKIGQGLGRKTVAVVSDMSQPLGSAIGNALEVKEAIETLKGRGSKDLLDLSLALASHMVVLAEEAKTIDEAKRKLDAVIQNGSALEKFKIFIASQGGDPSVVDYPDRLPKAAYQISLPALKSGYITKIVADNMGRAASLLGAGRINKNDPIDLSVGLILHKRIGDKVKEGETLVTVHTNREQIDDVIALVNQSIDIGRVYVEPPVLVHTVINE